MLEILRNCFTWKGRLDRADFCAGMLALAIGTTAFVGAVQADMFFNRSQGVLAILGFVGLFFVIWLLAFFIEASLAIRRMRDLGRPAVHVLFLLVPFYGLYILALLFFAKSKEEPVKAVAGRGQ